MPLLTRTEYARARGWHHSTLQQKIDRGHIKPDAFVTDEKGKILIDTEIADRQLAACLDMAQLNGFLATHPEGVKKREALEKAKLELVPEDKKPDPPKESEWEPALENLPDKPGNTIIPPGTPVKVIPPGESNNDFDRYQRAKATTEEERAKKLQLERAELEGRLLDAEEVRKEIVKLVSETKEKILNVAGKIAPELLSLTDVVEVETKLHAELVNALESLSRFDYEDDEGT